LLIRENNFGKWNEKYTKLIEYITSSVFISLKSFLHKNFQLCQITVSFTLYPQYAIQKHFIKYLLYIYNTSAKDRLEARGPTAHREPPNYTDGLVVTRPDLCRTSSLLSPNGSAL